MNNNVNDDTHSQLIDLPDNRQLSYAEYGSSTGKPIIYFHGFPGSRLELKRFSEVATETNYRLIAIDRPGFGLSTINKHRSILSTIEDVICLVDFLGIERFSVMGHSGGAPFVAALAYLHTERLLGAAIIAGMSPFTNSQSHVGMQHQQLIASQMVKKFPPLAYVLMWITKKLLTKSDKILDKLIKPLPEADQNIFRNPIKRHEVISSALEAFRLGISGAALEMKLLLQEWGFNLADIIFPVNIWHGNKDTQVPISNAFVYKQLIPSANLHVFENDGHHSIMNSHFKEIMQTL